MSVEPIKQNYMSHAGGFSNKTPVHSHSVAFKGKPIANDIIDTLKDKKIIKQMEKLEWLKGEIGGILITAIGTGLVAPLPIAFNPFAKAPKNATEEEKQDLKNTKRYTAMRQPISAVLAILFQVGALKPIDKLLDQVFNKPDMAKHIWAHVDQSEINKKSFVETTVKKELKKEGVKRPSLLDGFKLGWKNLKQERQKFDNILAERVAKIQEKQLDNVANNLQKTGNIKIASRLLDKPTLVELINSQIDDYIQDAQTLKYNNTKLSFYSDRAETLINNEAKLHELFDKVPTEKKELKNFLNGLFAKEKDPKIKEIIKEIIDRPYDIQKSHIDRTFERIDSIKAMCDGKYSFNNYLDAMTNKNAELDRIITNLKLTKFKDAKNITEKDIQATVAKIVDLCHFDKENGLLNSILHDTTTFSTDSKKLTSKVYKDISKMYKKMVENKYRGVNQIIKVIVGVCVTLPITCNVLNWVYPRIMEKCFPELLSSKKKACAKEGK